MTRTDDPLVNALSVDEALDLRAALSEAIDQYGKIPAEEGTVGDPEYVARWQALADRIDIAANMEEAQPPTAGELAGMAQSALVSACLRDFDIEVRPIIVAVNERGEEFTDEDINKSFKFLTRVRKLRKEEEAMNGRESDDYVRLARLQDDIQHFMVEAGGP